MADVQIEIIILQLQKTSFPDLNIRKFQTKLQWKKSKL